MTFPRELSERDFVGIGEHVPFFGVVEAIDDPLTLGRAKVRVFGFHSESKEDIPTKDLPWANVLLPTTSAGVGGQGSTINIKPGTWVAGYFADGRNGQYPIIIGVVPRVERPANAGDSGNAGGAYSGNDQDQYSTSRGNAPYYGDPAEGNKNSRSPLPNQPSRSAPRMPGQVGLGGTTGDDGAYLTDKDASNWPLKNYTFAELRGASRGASGGKGSAGIRIHRATALALDALASDVGKATVTSAYRSPKGNQAVGGAGGSQHMSGRAFDVRNSASPRRFILAAIKRGFVGFGGYDQSGRSIHIDTGSGRFWGPSFSAGSAPKWLTEILNSAEARNAGWYPGKPGLTGIKTEPGEQRREEQEQPNNEPGEQPSPGRNGNDPFNYSSNTNTAATQRAIVDEFRAAGYTDPQIAGVLGHAQNESGFNPLAVGDSGRSHGLFQWNGARFTGLQNFAAANGGHWSDPRMQARYAIHELNGSESRTAGDSLRNATNPTQASLAMNRYERFSGYQNPNGSESAERIRDSNDFYNGSEMEGSGTQTAENNTGFRDPSNSTRPEYKGKPTTNLIARGFNGGGQWANLLQHGATNTQSGFPIPGNRGTFAAIPASAAAPQYPYNHIVHASMTGHIIEMDDSPNAERINIQHRSGSKREFFPGGTVSDVVNGNYYHMASHNSYNGVVGDYYLGVKGDVNFRSTSDMFLHSDGGLMITSYNDRGEMIAGKYDVNAGDTVRFKSEKLVIIEGREGVHVYSTKNIHYHAEEDMHFKAGKNIFFEAGEEYQVTTKKSFQVKASEDFKVQGKNMHFKGSEKAHFEGANEMHMKSKKVKIGGGDSVEVTGDVNKVDPDWESGGDKPTAASAPSMKEVKDATDADMGPALKKKDVQNPQQKKQNPDTSIRTAAGQFYSRDA